MKTTNHKIKLVILSSVGELVLIFAALFIFTDIFSSNDQNDANNTALSTVAEPVEEANMRETVQSEVMERQNSGDLYGLWRVVNETGDVDLLLFMDNDYFSNIIYYQNGSVDRLRGTYYASDGVITIYDAALNDIAYQDEVTIQFSIDGDILILYLDGEENDYYHHVPEEYMDAVITNPFAPYPPGHSTGTLFTSDNLVDERFEVVSLVFYLAGHPDFANDTATNAMYGNEYAGYMASLNDTFGQYSNHPAVLFASEYFNDESDADILKFAMNIDPDFNKLFLAGEDFLFMGMSQFRDENLTAELLSHIINFRRDTGFDDFYQANIPFYIMLSSSFINDELLGSFDTGWFNTVATRYSIKQNNYKLIVSPSTQIAATSAWLNGLDTAYAMLPGIIGLMSDPYHIINTFVHECVHSFANAPAFEALFGGDAALFGDVSEQMWYWVENTAAGSIYTDDDEITIAVEYMVRAYTLLFFVDHGYDNYVTLGIERDKSLGFQFIENVYAMVYAAERGN